jgi:hypothetical protein
VAIVRGQRERALVVRNRYGFVGAHNALGLPRTVIDDTALDHGWSRWLPSPPQVLEVDADPPTILPRTPKAPPRPARRERCWDRQSSPHHETSRR